MTTEETAIDYCAKNNIKEEYVADISKAYESGYRKALKQVEEVYYNYGDSEEICDALERLFQDQHSSNQ